MFKIVGGGGGDTIGKVQNKGKFLSFSLIFPHNFIYILVQNKYKLDIKKRVKYNLDSNILEVK